MKKILTLTFLLFFFIGFSQKKNKKRTDKQPIQLEEAPQEATQIITEEEIDLTSDFLEQEVEVVTTDTTLISNKLIDFIEYDEANEFDKKWVEAWRSSEMISSLIIRPEDTIGKIVIDDFPTELLKERLQELNSKTPFYVEYNPSLEKVIKYYLKNRKETLANLMGRAKYYFPMFEEHLDKYDIPLELKYLAIVESALKPDAKSRVGAKGLWQFMYPTGKQYNLHVSSYVDERSDPIKSTQAACRYLSDLYKIFNDWELALAAYNSGPGNVNKAIRRAGGQKNYWNIRNYLPRETAGYVPAFYATYYIFEYAKEHQLYPKNEMLHTFETDTIVLKRQLSFEQINKILEIDDDLIELLNPQYKLKIIPVVNDRNYTLTIPKYLSGKFVANEAKIYAFAETDDAAREQPLPQLVENPDKIRYRVKSGDYLGKIASRHGVSVNSIKSWNGLKSNTLRVGQYLTIYPKNYVANTQSKTEATTSTTTKKELSKDSYTTYVVKKGDSLWLISQKFPKVTVSQIKVWNNIWGTNLKPGTELKIY